MADLHGDGLQPVPGHMMRTGRTFPRGGGLCPVPAGRPIQRADLLPDGRERPVSDEPSAAFDYVGGETDKGMAASRLTPRCYFNLYRNVCFRVMISDMQINRGVQIIINVFRHRS